MKSDNPFYLYFQRTHLNTVLGGPFRVELFQPGTLCVELSDICGDIISNDICVLND